MIAKRIDTIVLCSSCEKLVKIVICVVAVCISNCEELDKLCFISIIWYYFACNVVVIWLSLLMKTSRCCLVAIRP